MKKGSVLIFGAYLLLGSTHAWSQQVNNGKATELKIAPKALSNQDSTRVKQLYFSALREKMTGNSQLSSELFSRILQIDPANHASMYELARIKSFQKDNKSSRELLEKAVNIKPDNQWYWLALAEQYESASEWAKLETVCDQLIRLNPDKPNFYFDKANALFYQKKYEAALIVYGQLEKKIGLNDQLVSLRQKIYLKQGKIDKAASELEKLIAQEPGQVRYYLSLSELYSSNDQNEKALKVLLKAEKVDPAFPFLHLALADIYRTQKNKEASFEHLKAAFASPDLEVEQKIRIITGYFPKFPDPDALGSALQLSQMMVKVNPDAAKAQAVHGDILVYNKQLNEAKLAYRRAVELDSQIYPAWEQLVRLDLSDNDIEHTIKDGEAALSIFPNQAVMNYLVGIAWYQKKDFAQASSLLKNAVMLEIEDKVFLTQAYSALGDCYHQLKNHQASDEAYNSSLKYDPDNAYTLNNYAYYLSLRGEQLTKAEQMSRRSNELRPGSATFQDTYAWILFKQKKYADARLWMEKSVSNEKEVSPVQIEHFGDILFHLGELEMALGKWKSAKEAGLESPTLEKKIKERKYVE